MKFELERKNCGIYTSPWGNTMLLGLLSADLVRTVESATFKAQDSYLKRYCQTGIVSGEQ